MSEIRVDTISEKTSANGVAIDGVTLKDGGAALTGNLTIDDDSQISLGASADLVIRHNAANGNSFITDAGTGGLYIQANSTLALQSQGTSENFLVGTSDAGVKLYHNNNEKLETISTGINVTGAGTFTTTDNTDTLSLISTDADATAGPVLNLFRNSGSPADGDVIGRIRFDADDDGGNITSFVTLEAGLQDASNGSEDTFIDLKSFVAGTERNRLKLNATETVFNEDSIDLDFRVESNGTANMLFVNGGTNKVGIGTDAPAELLEVEGTGAAIQIDSNGDSALRFATGGTVKHSIFSSSGALNFFDNTNSANRWQIDATGNLVPGATSLGIYLGVSSATASNLLDDYEEGTFTYAINGSNSGNLNLRSGYARGEYVKVGNVVHIDLRFETDGDSSIDGNLQWTLPFTKANSNANDAGNSTAVGYIRDNSLGTNARTGVYIVGQSEAYAQLLFSREGAVNSTVELATDANTDGTLEGNISITYRTT